MASDTSMRIVITTTDNVGHVIRLGEPETHVYETFPETYQAVTRPAPNVGVAAFKWVPVTPYSSHGQPVGSIATTACTDIRLMVDGGDVLFDMATARWIARDHVVVRSTERFVYDVTELHFAYSDGMLTFTYMDQNSTGKLSAEETARMAREDAFLAAAAARAEFEHETRDPVVLAARAARNAAILDARKEALANAHALFNAAVTAAMKEAVKKE
jgi:hypothetical protein